MPNIEMIFGILLVGVVLAIILGWPVKPHAIYITHSGEPTFSFFKNKIYLPTYDGSPDYIFTATVKTHWHWFKNSWIKNILKSKNMSFKVKGISSNVVDLNISEGKVVPRTIRWSDDSGNLIQANVSINKKPNNLR